MKPLVWTWFWLLGGWMITNCAAAEVVIIGGEGHDYRADPGCFNRIHPEIPMVARAEPGQTILLHTRNSEDIDLDPGAPPDPREADPQFGAVHPLTGPVHINGAKRGDVLAVTLLDIEPGAYGMTLITPDGLVSDAIAGPLKVRWRLNRQFAVSDALPGVRIPNASFPGVVTVLPGAAEHTRMLRREVELAAAGGTVYGPHPLYASPDSICGPAGTHKDECLRTIPPREHGGNLDIRYLGVGATLYLPCYIDGCGLAVGDVHFAQGDGEVAGTAIEMDAHVSLTTRLIKDGPELLRGAHFEGPARLLEIPSRTFYATTGMPLKPRGDVPPDMAYLAAPKIATLENLSKDLTLAARNALLEMIDHIQRAYGLTREQAYIVASVAVDLRIGQVVDAPNVVVTAILPTDIFQADRP